MITDKIRENIVYALSQLYGITLKSDQIEIARPDKSEHGDYSTNVAFRLAKELGKSPIEIAAALSDQLTKDGGFARVEALGAYVNLFLDHKYYQDLVSRIIVEKENFANFDLLSGQKIQVEFVSANPTGPLTLGNSRGGFPGDVIANVLKKAGANVEREYYLNNGGNQIKMLGESILIAAGKMQPTEDYYRGEYIDDWVKQNQELIEKSVDDPFTIGQAASKYVVENFLKPTIEKMKIKYDVWFDEYDLVKKGEVEKILEKLDSQGLIYEKDGAKWFKSSEFGDEKDRVVVKSDGLYTYCAGDFAYHYNKFHDRKFDKVIDIWGADHHGDVLRVLGATEALGYKGKLEIQLAQFVRLIKDGQEFKMSKRKGTYVTMDDLLELIGGDVSEASDVARFFFLMRSFNTHMDFDLDLAKERSEKNPVFYVKYAYARMHGILANYQLQITNDKKANLELLVAPEELDLIDHLGQLEQVLLSIVSFDNHPVHLLTYYAIDLAKKFHLFYDKCRVIDAEKPELTAARIELVRAAQIVLGIVMRDLIGIDAPERM